MVKSLLVWLLLLALPLQGFAAATMLPCVPAPARLVATPADTMQSPHHDHRKMLAAQRAGHEAHAGGNHGTGDPATHHDGGSCKSCSACCPGNIMVTAFDILADTPHFAIAPFATGFVPVVDLAQPERPPQTSPV